MPKICKEEGCTHHCWGGGYCIRHQSSRVDKKFKRINKVSKAGKVKKEQKKLLIEEDKAFYMKIWEDREHICFETGEYISEPLMTVFHHVLEKSHYPEYRHCPWNIVLLLPDIHNQVHTNIDKTPNVLAYTIKLKEGLSEHRHEDCL